MKLLDIINACNGRVTGGTEYQWQCYGSHARYMDFADQDGTECISVVFDAIKQTVYELNLHVPGYDQAFVWRNPEFETNYLTECIHRKMEPNVAYDNIKYVPVDAETALQYTKDIVGTYYDNLPVPEVM